MRHKQSSRRNRDVTSKSSTADEEDVVSQQGNVTGEEVSEGDSFGKITSGWKERRRDTKGADQRYVICFISFTCGFFKWG